MKAFMDTKKSLLVVLVIAVLVVGVFFFVKRGNKQTQPVSEPILVSSTNATPQPVASDDAAVAARENDAVTESPIVDAAVSEIVGSWKNDELGYEFIYTFNADGTGKYSIMGSAMAFTYTLGDNKITITFAGDTAAFETQYRLDGETLNIIDSLGNDTLYQKMD